MTNEITVTCYINENGQTEVVCPKCFKSRLVSAEKFKGQKDNIGIRCPCGHLFKIQLEYRTRQRKETNFVGTYQLKPLASPHQTDSQARAPHSGGIVEIINISQTGLCFRARGHHGIQVEQDGRVQFVLDNRKEAKISKNVIIRNVEGKRIGCEFIQDQAYEKELGFYLRN
ncbi:PilZ domain-containing protein [Desulfotalea psychrophila]|uniref:PilZ domain-containing protein n=1 Tax=Desulfotalea psychrophila TaxID=84980 RepID=UPI0002E590F1|nr:PilZ domain-containing protein [Desulfotalea psychrophila]